MPRGTIAPDSPFFPFNDIGRGGQVSLNTSRVGLELQASNSRFANHAITYGLLWEYQAQDDLKTLTSDIGIGRPVYPLVDVSDTEELRARRQPNPGRPLH